MPNLKEAKDALDRVISKSRVHLYKPIQIAEILFRDRTAKDIALANLEDYRSKSKKWRDEICQQLLGRVCTSSAKFQDNLFDANAIPPSVLVALGKENRKKHGIVEAYIYGTFSTKHDQMRNALDYCKNTPYKDFFVKHFIDSFWSEPGLKRSLDKIYEIVVYALFHTLIKALDLTVEISIKEEAQPILKEFEDFSRKVMCLDFSSPQHLEKANVFRVGVTNAADRGLDMYSNWGPAIQIKHLSLDVELAREIVGSVSSDRIVIVCKDADRDVIVSLLTQIGWRARIQSVVTESDLVQWYEKALRGKFSSIVGEQLLTTLKTEIAKEFPSVSNTPTMLKERHYEKLHDPFWT